MVADVTADFDAVYARDADPWRDGSWYEQRKRSCVLAALPAREYRRGFEPGCARGALSEPLAARCAELVCWDVADRPVAETRARLAHRRHVRVDRGSVPGQWPAGTFDLIVVSELAYFLPDADRAALWRAARAGLDPEGALVVVDWQHELVGCPVSGAGVHDELAAVDGLERLVRHAETDFLLEVYAPAPARSVARRDGLR